MDVTEPASPDATPPPAAPKARHPRRTLAIASAVLLALVLLPAAGLVSGLWWTVKHPAGTAWLLQHVPTVQVTGPKGALLGDFEAERVEFDARPAGMHLVLEGVGWRGLAPGMLGNWRQWRVVFDELRARRIDFTPAPSDPAQPLKAPADLALPLEVEVKALRVGEFHMPALGDTPVRNIAAQLHLGAEGGTLHRVDALQADWDRLHASGQARIGTHAPLALDATVALAQAAAASGAAWNAEASLAGPLESPALKATLRAQASPSAKAQSLDAQATLRPFAPWPLGDLVLKAQALDLAAFSSAAPTTALNLDALAQTHGLNQPVIVTLALTNSAAGLWNEARLPVRRLNLDLRGRPDDTSTLDLHTIDAELGTSQRAAGTVKGSGRWTKARWSLDTVLAAVQPSSLDGRAPAMQFSGPVVAAGQGFDGATLDAATIDLKTTLDGHLADKGPARAVRLALDATLGTQAITLRSAEASAAGARATLAGQATRSANDAPWRIAGKTALVEFDPAPWWPGADNTPWRQGPHKLNAAGSFDITLPREGGAKPLAEQLAMLRGQADLKIARSLFAGVPIDGTLKLASQATGPVVASVQLEAAGNSLQAEGRLASTGSGSDDTWTVKIAAAALDKLAPLWHLAKGTTAADAKANAKDNAKDNAKADAVPAGSLNATVQVKGRWPSITTQGQLDASALHLAGASVQKADVHWKLGTALADAVDAQATLSQAAYGGVSLDTLQLDLKGSGRAHRLDLRAESKSLPPAWVDSVQAALPAAAAGSAPTASVAPGAATRTMASVQAQGGIVEAAGAPFAGWRGTLAQLELRGNNANGAPWVRTRDLGIDVQWAGGAHATVQPGRAELLGAALRWSRITWQEAQGVTPAQLDVDAELEPLSVAPLLVRLQPDFGWGGDLAIGGHIKVQSAPSFTADIVLERARGDLTVTDETGTQALELTDLRLALNASEGTWNFTQALAGKTLGQVAGLVVARTTPQTTWPARDTPIEGLLELQVANLGTWGTWVPAGWRLGGALRTSAVIGGRFGAPEYTGTMRGTGLSVRNFLQGVNVTDGDVSVALQGDTARIERFTAKAGSGTVTLTGDASLGEAPRAQLKLVADKFQLLGRVDRRIVTSGTAQVTLDRKSVALDGEFGIDEGLIDFTRSDAPSLADDVEVVRAKPVDAPAAAPHSTSTTPARTVAVNLKVNLGEKLRLRGRGIDTGLRGELRMAVPNGRLTINGNVTTAEGTYAAYGQKLTIDRGLIAFGGVAENPRLDIEATRPNLDTRVGVQITGTAQNPRIRLFSEPEVSDIDKLSWLVLGRASDGLGRADTALLQQAAVALLSGEGEGLTDQFTKAIGLDALSLRQQTDGDVRETVISLGKQLSRRWYVGYERGLNATTGTWQLIYRIAQRFTLRAQSGLDNSLDIIWTWRWQ